MSELASKAEDCAGGCHTSLVTPREGDAESVLYLEVRELRVEVDRLRVEVASKQRDVERLVAERKALTRGVRRLLAQARGERRTQ